MSHTSSKSSECIPSIKLESDCVSPSMKRTKSRKKKKYSTLNSNFKEEMEKHKRELAENPELLLDPSPNLREKEPRKKSSRHRRSRSVVEKDNTSGSEPSTPRNKDSGSEIKSHRKSRREKSGEKLRDSKKLHDSKECKTPKSSDKHKSEKKNEQKLPTERKSPRNRTADTNSGRYGGLFRRVRATRDYVPQDSTELCVKAGDEIILRGLPEEGWCEGAVDSNIGWFPVHVSDDLITLIESDPVYLVNFLILVSLLSFILVLII